MTIIPQAAKYRSSLIVVIFCLVLVLPAGASENPQEGFFLTAELIDQTVFDGQGKELGEVEDFVIKRNGSVKKALISVGGFLDVGGKLVAVKYKSLKFEGRKIILDITKKQLDDSPEYDYRKQDLFTNYHYRIRSYGMMPGPYGPEYRQRWQEPGDPGNPRPRRGFRDYGREDRPDGDDRPYFRHHRGGMYGMRNWHRPWGNVYYPARMLASVILGQTVVNKQGEDIARVEDIAIDETTGKAKKLILSYGGVLDIGDKRVAVPYQPVGFTDKGIIYDVTARELETQPKFTGLQ
jgi:sporulation protein YlmC with PRC-barrel domain